MSRKITRAENTALARISDTVPPVELRAILEKSADPRARHLFNLLLDPNQNRCTLPTLCQKAGLYYEDVLLMLTRGRVGDGIEKMSRHAPKVFEDIAVDAESQLVVCPECRGEGEKVVGKGKHAETVVCWVCEGAKKIRKSGDSDARDFMLTALGVINKNKGGGTNVQVNVNGAGVSSVEDDLELTGEVIDVVAESVKPAP